MHAQKESFDVDDDHLFTSVLVGSGIMASISMAMILQVLYPVAFFLGLPVAGCAGLMFGWTVAYPAARLLVRRFQNARGDIASAAAIGLSLLLSVPACLFAPAIGLGSFVVLILFLAVMAGIGGLFFGGYMVDQGRG